MLKKILKTISSRMFYLILGLSLAVGIFVARAAWNSYVSGGQTLTATAWNEIVAKSIELDGRGTCPSCGTCWSEKLNPSSLPYCGCQDRQLCTPGGWRTTTPKVVCDTQPGCFTGDGNDQITEDLEFLKKIIRNNEDMVNQGLKNGILH